jgi:hypothetical protein
MMVPFCTAIDSLTMFSVNVQVMLSRVEVGAVDGVMARAFLLAMNSAYETLPRTYAYVNCSGVKFYPTDQFGRAILFVLVEISSYRHKSASMFGKLGILE